MNSYFDYYVSFVLAASRNVKPVTGDRRLFNAAGAHLPWIVWIEEWQRE
ncbi:hypothetical protein [Desulfofundulus thermocisternus]|nr:hypothetical protein [Desulfofundulus thermocisternus]